MGFCVKRPQIGLFWEEEGGGGAPCVVLKLVLRCMFDQATPSRDLGAASTPWLALPVVDCTEPREQDSTHCEFVLRDDDGTSRHAYNVFLHGTDRMERGGAAAHVCQDCITLRGSACVLGQW